MNLADISINYQLRIVDNNMYSSLEEDASRVKSRKGAIAAGIVMGIAIWLTVSVMVNPDKGCGFKFLFIMPHIFSMAGFLMVNLVSWESMDVRNADMYTNPNVPCINKSIMLAGILVCFSCIGGSVGVMVNWYAEPKHNNTNDGCSPENGARDGVIYLTSCVLMAISMGVFRIGNTPANDDY